MKPALLLIALLSSLPSYVSASTSALEAEIANRVARLEQQMATYAQNQLRLQQTLDQVQREISELRGKSEEQQYQTEQIINRQRQMYESISGLEQKVDKLAVEPKSSVVQPQTQAPSLSLGSLSEADSYNKALDLATKERKFDEAIVQFRAFTQQYPQSSYTPNAYYWLGQLLYSKGELAEAGAMFSTVAQQYPDSNKRADSLLKQGMIAQRQGDQAKANTFFKQVMAEHNNTSAAQLAQKYLK